MHKFLFIITFFLLNLSAIILSSIAPFYKLWQVVFILSLSFSFLFFVFETKKNRKYFKLSLVIQIVALVVVFLFIIFYYTGLLSHFASLEEAKKWFESFGIIADIIFFIIQVAQVVILPIPAQITTIAGVLIFGAMKTFLISSLAVILGSMICFFIGRVLGLKIIYKLASYEIVDKYRDIITSKGKILLPIMFLFPMFPDDLLCFIAGTTKLSWPYFIITTITTRLVGIFCICYFGSGDIIPFHGWGIPVWICLIIALIIALYFIFKYQTELENFIINKFSRKNKKSGES